MEKRSSYTISTLLEELKQKFPKFEKNQVFETLKSIYPDTTVSRKNKNITFNNKTFTKPLALNRKDKKMLLKEENEMISFFRNVNRGDFLKVIKIENNQAKCINLSLCENTRKKYYNDNETKYVILTFDDIASGNVRLMRRKINKYLEDVGKKPISEKLPIGGKNESRINIKRV